MASAGHCLTSHIEGAPSVDQRHPGGGATVDPRPVCTTCGAELRATASTGLRGRPTSTGRDRDPDAWADAVVDQLFGPTLRHRG